jgi:hypothetical protein
MCVLSIVITTILSNYRINWHISPHYVARARQMTLSKVGLIEMGIYYVDGLCAIQILLGRDSDPSPGGDL